MRIITTKGYYKVKLFPCKNKDLIKSIQELSNFAESKGVTDTGNVFRHVTCNGIIYEYIPF